MRAHSYALAKRALDVVVSLAVLALTAPLLLVLAIVVAVGYGRPILFRQRRPGLDGRPFELVKFRTMREGDGSDAERLTPLGRLLRSTSLDELPELINVLRGEMSLVGPRPLLPEYLELYDERQARRHEVRPGMTGLAQVSGRNALDWDDRLELDVQYVERASLGLDLLILSRTATSILRRDGISAPGAATMQPFTGSAGGTR